MKIRFVGHRPRELAVGGGRTMQPGEEFEVPDALGRRLLEQPRWYEAVEQQKKTSAAKPSAKDEE